MRTSPLRRLILPILLVCTLSACNNDAAREAQKQWKRFDLAAKETWEEPNLADEKKINFAGAFTGTKGRYFLFNVYPGTRNKKLDDTPSSQVRNETVDFHGTPLEFNIRWTSDPAGKADPRLVMTAPLPDPDIANMYHMVFVYSHASIELSDTDRMEVEEEVRGNMIAFFDTLRDHSAKRDYAKARKEEEDKARKEEDKTRKEERDKSRQAEKEAREEAEKAKREQAKREREREEYGEEPSPAANKTK